MPANRSEALKLPDSLLVRYFRAGELDHVQKVTTTAKGARVKVNLTLRGGKKREDHWQDLAGGLGFVPADAGD